MILSLAVVSHWERSERDTLGGQVLFFICLGCNCRRIFCWVGSRGGGVSRGTPELHKEGKNGVAE